jgi:hypothetical protein
MTDCYSPASWDGVAERDGYVAVVDVSPGSSVLKRSGGWSTAKQVPGDNCARCRGTGQEPDGWTHEQALAAPREFNLDRARRQTPGAVPLMAHVISPLSFDKEGRETCVRCAGLGHTWKLEPVRVDWPEFTSNPSGRLWHVEKEGRILDSGVGLGPCADWDRERAAAAVGRIVSRIEAAVARNKGHTSPTTTQDRAAATEVILRRNFERQGIEVVFPAKPAEEVRAGLKRLGFRWSRRQGLWYARYADGTWQRVQALLESTAGAAQEPAMPTPPGAGVEVTTPETPEDAPPRATETPQTGQVTGGNGAGPGKPEPWQMTRLAYQESRAVRIAGGVPILNARDGREHEAAVRRAAATGLLVPAHVLAEYGLAEEVHPAGPTACAVPATLQPVLFPSP